MVVFFLRWEDEKIQPIILYCYYTVVLMPLHLNTEANVPVLHISEAYDGRR